MYSDSSAVRENTLLTPQRVAEKTTFLDWDTQPSLFKHYPDFCYRVSLADHPSLQWLSETRTVTDLHSIAGKPYRRLNVPSAGNLHPLEIYVQIRNSAGLLSGIYHLDTLAQELVLIQEIGGEGIEPYVGWDHRFSGFIVMISLVPFRSSWKYGLRGWRYCYLDLGHQIAALSASVRHFGMNLTKMSVNDPQQLNHRMGMGDDEAIAAVFGIGENTSRSVKGLHETLMRVQPTDYTINNKILTNIIDSPIYSEIVSSTVWEDYERLNRTRRSAREFIPSVMRDEAIAAIMQLAVPSKLEVVTIILQAHSMHSGVYRKGILTQAGNYRTDIIHLLLEQRFIAGANMVLLIYAEAFDARHHIEAGIYAHELYLVSEHLGIGCSGIGAFYDGEGSCWSDNALLYAVAIGGRK